MKLRAAKQHGQNHRITGGAPLPSMLLPLLQASQASELEGDQKALFSQKHLILNEAH